MGCTGSRPTPPPRTSRSKKRLRSEKSDLGQPPQGPTQEKKPSAKEETKPLVNDHDDEEVKTEEGIDFHVKIKRDDLLVCIET